MDVEVPSCFRELDERLRKFGASVVEAFRPGAPAERVRTVLDAEGLHAHDDLIAWFGWHDGSAGTPLPEDYDGPGIFFSAETTLVGSWHVISLDDAVRTRRWLGQIDDSIPASWFPVLQYEGQPVLAADTAAAGPATLHIIDEVPDLPPPQFDSIVDFVRTVLRLFDEDMVVPDPQQPGVLRYEFSLHDADLRRLDSW